MGPPDDSWMSFLWEAIDVLMQAGASGLVMAVVLLKLFHVQERHKLRSRRSAHAGSILLELNRIREKFWPELGARSLEQSGGVLVSDLPRSTYDGLVSSAAISTFSNDVQRQLAEFYDLLRMENIESMRQQIPTLIYDVSREKTASDWQKSWKHNIQTTVAVLVEYTGLIHDRLKTLNIKPDTTTAMQLNTRADLVAALGKPGFLVVKKRSGGRSRIHRTSCKTFWFEIEMVKFDVELDKKLGRGKAKQEYYHCGTWDGAVEKWNELMAREPIPCSKCRPGPEDSPE